MPYPADPYSLRHSEFGWCENAEYRYTSQWRGPDEDDLKPLEEEPSLIVYLTTYISYLILICIGHMRDFIGKRTHKAHYKSLTEQNVCLFSFNGNKLMAHFAKSGLRSIKFRF